MSDTSESYEISDEEIEQSGPKKCQEVEYVLLGHGDQLLEVRLEPGRSVVGEAGSMCFMQEGVQWETKLGDGSNPDQGLMSKWVGGLKRMMTGSTFFTAHFSNATSKTRSIGFSAPHLGSVVAIDMQKEGGAVLCQKGSFLCASLGTKIDMAINTKIKSGIFGGENLIFQRIEGDDMLFIHSGGSVTRKDLRDESLIVEAGCLVAFSEGINFDVKFSGGLKTMMFGQEGIFMSKLSGTGSVWIQSVPFQRVADRVVQHSDVFKELSKKVDKMSGGPIK